MNHGLSCDLKLQHRSDCLDFSVPYNERHFKNACDIRVAQKGIPFTKSRVHYVVVSVCECDEDHGLWPESIIYRIKQYKANNSMNLRRVVTTLSICPITSSKAE